MHREGRQWHGQDSSRGVEHGAERDAIWGAQVSKQAWSIHVLAGILEG